MQKKIILTCLLINSLMFCADHTQAVDLALYRTLSHRRLIDDAQANAYALAFFMEFAKDKVTPQDKAILIKTLTKEKIMLGALGNGLAPHVENIENIFNLQLKIHNTVGSYIEKVESIAQHGNQEEQQTLSTIQRHGVGLYHDATLKGLTKAQNILKATLPEHERRLIACDLNEIPEDHYQRIATVAAQFCTSPKNEFRILLYERLKADIARHTTQMTTFMQTACKISSLDAKRDLFLQFQAELSREQLLLHTSLIQQLLTAQLTLYPSCQRYMQEFAKLSQEDGQTVVDTSWKIINDDMHDYCIGAFLCEGLIEAKRILYENVKSQADSQLRQIQNAEQECTIS